jgi:hypothetical protein
VNPGEIHYLTGVFSSYARIGINGSGTNVPRYVDPRGNRST